MNKILLIGGTGKIGKYVLDELLRNKEFDVRLLLRGTIDNKFSKNTSFHGDIMVRESLYEGVEWCDVVVNCAGMVSYKTSDYALLNRINVDGTKNILDACSKFNRPLLHTSSAVVYGSTLKPISHLETFSVPTTYLSGYARSKLAADQMIFSSSIKSLILRPSTLISPSGSTFAKLFSVYKMGFRAGLEGGASFVSPSDISQVYGRAILYLLKNEFQKNIFNIGGNNILIKGVFDFFLKYKPRKTFYISNKMLNALSYLNDRFLLPVLNKSIITRDNYLTGSLFTYLNSDKAIRELGYSITPFPEAAKKILNNADHGR